MALDVWVQSLRSHVCCNTAVRALSAADSLPLRGRISFRGAMAVPCDLRAAAGRIKYQNRKHASSTGAASQPAVPRGGCGPGFTPGRFGRLALPCHACGRRLHALAGPRLNSCSALCGTCSNACRFLLLFLICSTSHRAESRGVLLPGYCSRAGDAPVETNALPAAMSTLLFRSCHPRGAALPLPGVHSFCLR